MTSEGPLKVVLACMHGESCVQYTTDLRDKSALRDKTEQAGKLHADMSVFRIMLCLETRKIKPLLSTSCVITLIMHLSMN